MEYYPPSLVRLIKHLSKLPGIGEKTATRLALHILRSSEEEARKLSQSILDVKYNVRLFGTCFGLSDTDPCTLCRNPNRNRTLLCIVEQPSDMVALEKAGAFNGLYHVLELARQHHLRVFCPSSIATFGPETPRHHTPQETVLRPRTMYGVTKVAGELLCNYAAGRYGVDIRGVRYPGIISNVTPPGGGTTDYAVEIFYAAVRGQPYACFVRPDTILPMMYMPDCIQATLETATIAIVDTAIAATMTIDVADEKPPRNASNARSSRPSDSGKVST